MKKVNEEYLRLPIKQIWTDMDLAKFAMIAFIIGFILGSIL